MNAEFIRVFNLGNAAFTNSCGEFFEVSTKSVSGVKGQYVANSIDDLTVSEKGILGGKIDVAQVNVFIDKTVLAQSKIIAGSILVVRGNLVRVESFGDAGDNKVMASCTKVGVAPPAS